MTPQTERRARGMLAFLLTVVLAIWIGASLFTDIATVPLAFEALPRVEAAEFGQKVFSSLNRLEALLGLMAVLLAFFLGLRGWGTRRRHVTASVILISMTGIALIYLLVLTPGIRDRWQELKVAGANLGDPTATSPGRESLKVFHAIYGVLEILKISGGVATFWLLATRPR